MTKRKIDKDFPFMEEIGTERTPEEVAAAFPKSQMVVYPQKIKMIPLEAAIQFITNWWEKDPIFHWEQTPAWVIIKMLEAVEDEGSGEALVIPYIKAVSILKLAETNKMDGAANKGMRYIQDEWKKLYLP